MTGELGQLALCLALALSLVQAFSGFTGASRANLRLMAMGRGAALGSFVFIALAFFTLMFAYVTSDFSVSAVAENSHTAKPLIYKISGVWGNHEGSMILWLLILGIYSAAIAMTQPTDNAANAELGSRALGVQALIAIAFLVFVLLTSDPFLRLYPPPFEGNGLNPLLQDPGLAFHPPLLYLGYVGLSAAFSFAAAALLDKRNDAAWVRRARPFVTAAWTALTLGIAAGSWWAYYTLGWGGFWFWDPVENASLMPWLIATALIHSMMATERTGAFKSWTLLLAIAAFSFSLIGTFLVRSGVLNSVHSFANDPEARPFHPDDPVRRDHRAAGAVRLARAQTVAGRAVRSGQPRNRHSGQQSAADRFGGDDPYRHALPAGARRRRGDQDFRRPALFHRDRRSDAGAARDRHAVRAHLPVAPRQLAQQPLRAALRLGCRWRCAAGRSGARASLFGARCCGGRVGGMADRRLDHRHGAARRQSQPPPAIAGERLDLGHCPCRSWRGGAGLRRRHDVEERGDPGRRPGQTMNVAGYTLRLDSTEQVQGPNYSADRAAITVMANGQTLAVVHPEKRSYPVEQMVTTQSAIRTTVISDLYIVLGDSREGGGWVVRAYVNPMAPFIWIGGMIMALAGFIALCSGIAARVRATRAAAGAAAQPAE